jgi:hypothetical protein
METIEATFKVAFPEQPVPKAFFAGSEGLGHDIPFELAARVQGRPWTTLSMLDWRLVGAPPSVFREYMAPATFAYYVPSLLLGAVAEPAFCNWAFEALLPSNRERKPKGDWWLGYVGTFNDQQREAIKAFLAKQRQSGRAADPMDEELLRAAEALWV